MITSADIKSGSARAILRKSPEARKWIHEAKGKLAGKIEVGSDVQSGGGKAWVRIRVKIQGTYARWFTDESLAKDLQRMATELLEIRWRHHDFDKMFDPGLPWQEREEAVAEALSSLLMEDAECALALDKLQARVAKIFENRRKTMPDKQKAIWSEHVQQVMKDMQAQMADIRDSVGEDDIVQLWREALVKEVAES
jgi:hypothetical protein